MTSGTATRLLRSVTGQRIGALVRERTGDPCLARDADIVSRVLPFKVSSYVTDELIDWTCAPDDPIYRMVFPHRDMLDPEDFALVAAAVDGGDPAAVRIAADKVRDRLNPHPGNQLTMNVPHNGDLEGWGLQHKYAQTVLVFPRQGQTCHSFCGYCFRWAQFVDRDDLKLAVSGPQIMVDYLGRHREVTDVLLTGGDPLVMSTNLLASYIEPLLADELSHIRTVRIGTKVLAFWPYRVLAGPDGDALLRLLERVVAAGRHLALVLHISHPRELETAPAQEALRRLAATGAVLRAQAPLVRHVNDDADIWARMWREQVRLAVVPYYMFVERDTGAQRYFGLPLARAVDIYREATRQVSGLARTARGPVMSATPGKVCLDGVAQLPDGPAFVLRYLQARDVALVGRPFFARFDPAAQWWNDLRPYGPADRTFFGTDA